MSETGRRSPKANDEDKATFRTLVPRDERVSVKPMFGTLSAFAGGQMFMCLIADELLIRLPPPDRQRALDSGGRLHEMRPGRTLREYVAVPNWRENPARVHELTALAIPYALSLPPKKK